jgi:UDP-glucose 4-epimerase
MKILVTGSEGYIGKHLIKMLGDEHEVIGLDIKADDFMMSTDITKLQTKAPRELAKFDVVIHLAAKVKVNESVTRPWLYYNTNVNGTKNILKHVRCGHFIFASTGVAENPTNPYALSKRIAEDVVKEHCEKTQTNYTIFRFYNVIGSDGFEPTNPDGLFYNLNKAVETGRFNLCGTNYDTIDGTCVRDYIHVNEVCNAIISSLYQASNQVENLGTGQGHTVMEIIRQYKKTNKVDFDVLDVGRREGDLEVSVLDDPSPFFKKLYTFEELLRK